MAKRSTKAPKKREQPWMAAAREKLHEKAERREETAVTEGFLNLALPALHALDARTGSEEFARTLAWVKLAWNLPLLHAFGTEPGSDGAVLRAEAVPLLARLPAYREMLVPLLRARVSTYRHLTRPIFSVSAGDIGDDLQLAIKLGEEQIRAVDLLEMSDSGWPKASRSLLVLARPALARLPEPYEELGAKRVMAMALIAWNLPMLDGPEALVSSELRRITLAGALVARGAPDEVRAVFEEMVDARSTRFGYDPRTIAGVAVRVEGGLLHVDTGSLRLG